MIASTAGLSLVSIVAVLIAGLAGSGNLTGGVWPVVLVLPLIGLPIAFVLIVVLLALGVARRRRAARDGGS